MSEDDYKLKPYDPNDWDNLSREEIERRLCENWYKLDENRNVVPVQSMLDSATWDIDRTKRRVAHTYYNYEHDGRAEYVWVATDFLGLDHGWGKGPPVVFETMFFDFPVGDEDMKRYRTWAEAVIGHEEACKRVEQYLNQEGYVFTRTADEPSEYTIRKRREWRKSLRNLKKLHKELEEGKLQKPEDPPA